MNTTQKMARKYIQSNPGTTDKYLVQVIRDEIARQEGATPEAEIVHAPVDFDLTEFLKKQAE